MCGWEREVGRDVVGAVGEENFLRGRRRGKERRKKRERERENRGERDAKERERRKREGGLRERRGENKVEVLFSWVNQEPEIGFIFMG